MQASRPRNTHTPAAIKQAKHTPVATLAPEPYPQVVIFCTQILHNRCGLLCPAGGADYEYYEYCEYCEYWVFILGRR